MANRYWRATATTTYATAGNWELTPGGGEAVAVPTSADDVFFTSSSGATCSIAAAAAAKTVTCTGYTGTITVQNTFSWTVAGNVTLASGMILTTPSTGVLVISVAGNLDTAGCTIGCRFTVTAAITVTLLANATCSQLVTLGNTANTTLNGFSLSCSNSLTTNQRVLGTTNLILTGTGTWTGLATVSKHCSLNVEINTAGTITFAAVGPNLGGNTVTLTAGTVVTTGSSVYLSGNVSLLGTWPNLNILTCLLDTSALTINNNLTVATLTHSASMVAPTTNTFTVTTFNASTTAKTFTLGANNVVIGTLTQSIAAFTFGGTGFTIPITNLNNTATATLTYGGNTLNATNMTCLSAFTFSLVGTTGPTIGTLTTQDGSTLNLPISVTTTISTALNANGCAGTTTTIKSGTASSTATIALATATFVSERIIYTDITVTGKVVQNWQGGTLLRTSGIQNFTTTPNDFSDPGIANVKYGVEYTYNTSSLTGTYQAQTSCGSIG